MLGKKEGGGGGDHGLGFVGLLHLMTGTFCLQSIRPEELASDVFDRLLLGEL